MLLDQFVFGEESYPTLLQQFTAWAETENQGNYTVLVIFFWGTVLISWLWSSFLADIRSEKVYVPLLDGTKDPDR